MVLPKINLHIHSNYSDGAPSIAEIVAKAVDLEFDYIAITDHFSNTWKANIINTLENPAKISKYLFEIYLRQEALKKEKSQLKVLRGIEIDVRSSMNFIWKNIDSNHYQIILLEHFDQILDIKLISKLYRHWKQMLNSDSKFPIIGLAHFRPDYPFTKYMDFLLHFLEDFDIFFEFNSSYSQFYSSEYKGFFDEIKARKIPVGIGSDAHSAAYIRDIEDPLEKIINYGLEENFKRLISKLEAL